MSWVENFNEEERKRYDELHRIPRNEWSDADFDLYIAFEAAAKSAEAEAEAAREDRRRALEAEIEAAQESAKAAMETSKALHDRAISRWERIRGLDG